MPVGEDQHAARARRDRRPEVVPRVDRREDAHALVVEELQDRDRGLLASEVVAADLEARAFDALDLPLHGIAHPRARHAVVLGVGAAADDVEVRRVHRDSRGRHVRRLIHEVRPLHRVKLAGELRDALHHLFLGRLPVAQLLRQVPPEHVLILRVLLDALADRVPGDLFADSRDAPEGVEAVGERCVEVLGGELIGVAEVPAEGRDLRQLLHRLQ